jgi:hypothetical protein
MFKRVSSTKPQDPRTPKRTFAGTLRRTKVRERRWEPVSTSCKAGPGDPAAPRTNCLPLLPSGPGGVHRVLLHRAQPLKHKIFPVATISEAPGRASLVWRRGWAFEVALANASRAPTEGASPLVRSPRGGYFPRGPPVRIPPSPSSDSVQLPQLNTQHS